MSAPAADELIEHIRQAARQSCEYIEGLAREDFIEDKRTQQAVVLNLIIVGEAATRLMDDHPDMAAAYSDVPWRSMRGMRNRIAHG